MSFSHEYNLPVFISAGGVLTTGKTSDLGRGQMGIFKAKDFSVASGSLNPMTALIVAEGSLHSRDKLGNFIGGLMQSDKTIEFLLKDILSFERSKPLVAQSEQWVLGWDGLNDCNALTFKCGTDYRFLVSVWGEDTYGTYTKRIYKEIGFTTKCCADTSCTTGDCLDSVGSKQYADMIRDQINADPELKFFVKANTISSDWVTTAQTHSIYQLATCDAGGILDLAFVQNQYPTIPGIYRVNRIGGTSVYEVCKATGLPAAFQPTSSMSLADCGGACPSGYTLSAATDTWTVQRPLAGSEALTDDAAKATYAGTVTTAYTGSNGKFLSTNGAVATIQFDKVAGVVPTVLLADVNLIKIFSKAATCNITTPPSTIVWTTPTNAARYRVFRTLCLQLSKPCDTAVVGTRLAELIAFYANDTSIKTAPTVKTAGFGLTPPSCTDVYQLDQWSDDCSVDGCLTKPLPTYHNIQSFEGFTWGECPCPAVVAEDLVTKSGVALTAAYEQTKFGGCSFSPLDYYSVRPLRIEIVHLVGAPGMIGQQFGGGVNNCLTPFVSRRTRFGKQSTQSGEFIVREYLRAKRYSVHGEFYYDPRLREIMDGNVHEIIDKNAPYTTYHLKVRQNRLYQNHNADYSPEIYEFVIAVPSSTNAATVTAFETYFENVTAQNGVYLQDR